MKLANMVKDIYHRGRYFVHAKSPELLMIGGFVTGAACIAAVVVGTVKAAPIVEHAKCEIDRAEYVKTDAYKQMIERYQAYHAENDLEVVIPEECNKTKRQIVTETALAVSKQYIVAFGLALASAGCFLGAYKVLDKRLLGATALYEATSAAFTKYRKRVVDELGEEVDKKFFYGDNVKKVTKTDPETGEEYEEYVPNVEKDAPWYSLYSFTYKNESHHPDFDVMQARNDQEYWTTKLNALGYIEANDIYMTMPGHQGEKKGEWCGIGWISLEWQKRLKDLGVMPASYCGDGFISFGVFDGEGGPQAAAWREGKSKEVIMDLNVDGPIYKFIDAINHYDELVAAKCDSDCEKKLRYERRSRR